MVWYLVKLVTNIEGQYAPSVIEYEGENALSNARVDYHNALAAYNNADDVLYAVVEILRGLDGSVFISEIVDHRPPEPEPNDDEN